MTQNAGQIAELVKKRSQITEDGKAITGGDNYKLMLGDACIEIEGSIELDGVIVDATHRSVDEIDDQLEALGVPFLGYIELQRNGV